jgi:hypothetical protein
MPTNPATLLAGAGLAVVASAAGTLAVQHRENQRKLTEDRARAARAAEAQLAEQQARELFEAQMKDPMRFGKRLGEAMSWVKFMHGGRQVMHGELFDRLCMLRRMLVKSSWGGLGDIASQTPADGVVVFVGILCGFFVLDATSGSFLENFVLDLRALKVKTCLGLGCTRLSRASCIVLTKWFAKVVPLRPFQLSRTISEEKLFHRSARFFEDNIRRIALSAAAWCGSEVAMQKGWSFRILSLPWLAGEENPDDVEDAEPCPPTTLAIRIHYIARLVEMLEACGLVCSICHVFVPGHPPFPNGSWQEIKELCCRLSLPLASVEVWNPVCIGAPGVNGSRYVVHGQRFSKRAKKQIGKKGSLAQCLSEVRLQEQDHREKLEPLLNHILVTNFDRTHNFASSEMGRKGTGRNSTSSCWAVPPEWHQGELARLWSKVEPKLASLESVAASLEASYASLKSNPRPTRTSAFKDMRDKEMRNKEIRELTRKLGSHNFRKEMLDDFARAFLPPPKMTSKEVREYNRKVESYNRKVASHNRICMRMKRHQAELDGKLECLKEAFRKRGFCRPGHVSEKRRAKGRHWKKIPVEKNNFEGYHWKKMTSKTVMHAEPIRVHVAAQIFGRIQCERAIIAGRERLFRGRRISGREESNFDSATGLSQVAVGQSWEHAAAQHGGPKLVAAVIAAAEKLNNDDAAILDKLSNDDPGMPAGETTGVRENLVERLWAVLTGIGGRSSNDEEIAVQLRNDIQRYLDNMFKIMRFRCLTSPRTNVGNHLPHEYAAKTTLPSEYSRGVSSSPYDQHTHAQIVELLCKHSAVRDRTFREIVLIRTVGAPDWFLRWCLGIYTLLSIAILYSAALLAALYDSDHKKTADTVFVTVTVVAYIIQIQPFSAPRNGGTALQQRLMSVSASDVEATVLLLGLAAMWRSSLVLANSLLFFALYPFQLAICVNYFAKLGSSNVLEAVYSADAALGFDVSVHVYHLLNPRWWTTQFWKILQHPHGPHIPFYNIYTGNEAYDDDISNTIQQCEIECRSIYQDWQIMMARADIDRHVKCQSITDLDLEMLLLKFDGMMTEQDRNDDDEWDDDLTSDEEDQDEDEGNDLEAAAKAAKVAKKVKAAKTAKTEAERGFGGTLEDFREEERAGFKSSRAIRCQQLKLEKKLKRLEKKLKDFRHSYSERGREQSIKVPGNMEDLMKLPVILTKDNAPSKEKAPSVVGHRSLGQMINEEIRASISEVASGMDAVQLNLPDMNRDAGTKAVPKMSQAATSNVQAAAAARPLDSQEQDELDVLQSHKVITVEIVMKKLGYSLERQGSHLILKRVVHGKKQTLALSKTPRGKRFSRYHHNIKALIRRHAREASRLRARARATKARGEKTDENENSKTNDEFREEFETSREADLEAEIASLQMQILSSKKDETRAQRAEKKEWKMLKSKFRASGATANKENVTAGLSGEYHP